MILIFHRIQTKEDNISIIKDILFSDAFYTAVTPSDDLDWAMYGQGSPSMLTHKQKEILENLKSQPKQNVKQKTLLTRRSKWKKQYMWNINELENELCIEDLTPTASISSKCSNFHVLPSEELQVTLTILYSLLN